MQVSRPKKLKIIIVDDEITICQLIRRLIDWKHLGITLVGEAHDGLEAISMLEQHKPDIAIIDMRIPEIDGIEVIRQCANENIATRFIVISGYREFEYAQQALSYNVSNYLVKPINQDELNHSLTKVIDEVRTSKRTSSQIESMHSKLVAQKNLMLSSYINDIQQGKCKYSDIKEANRSMGTNFKNGLFSVFIVKFDLKFAERFNNNIIPGYVEKIFDAANFECCYEYAFLHINERIVFICNYPKEAESAFTKALNSAFQRALNYVSTYGFCNITIGIGQKKNQISEMYLSYQEAMSAIEYRRKIGTQKAIWYTEDIPMISFNTTLSDHERNCISQAIGTRDGAKLLSFLSQQYSEYYHDTNFEVRFSLHAAAITNNFFDILLNFSSQPEEVNKIRNDLLFYIDNEIHTPLIKKEMEETFSRLFKSQIDNNLFWEDRHIRIAKQYIHDHYADTINLNNLSDAVNLNSIYFCSLFKKKLGITYLEYLTQVRISAAKKLFTTTQFSVKDVCGMVGYVDVRYFSKLFKKCVGVTPSVYRKIHSSL